MDDVIVAHKPIRQLNVAAQLMKALELAINGA